VKTTFHVYQRVFLVCGFVTCLFWWTAQTSVMTARGMRFVETGAFLTDAYVYFMPIASLAFVGFCIFRPLSNKVLFGCLLLDSALALAWKYL
jgi:hypothetical protein